ncbi:MAG: type VII secretion target [Pseudonocardiaceae bacterium]
MDFAVTAADIRGHARSIRGLADRIDPARQAAGQALPSPMAFGLLCGPILLPAYQVVVGVAERVIAGAESQLAATAQALTSTAQSYDDVDRANRDGLRAAEVSR